MGWLQTVRETAGDRKELFWFLPAADTKLGYTTEPATPPPNKNTLQVKHKTLGDY